MKQGFVELTFTQALIGFVELLPDQDVSFLLLERLDFFANLAIAGIIREAL